jgi:hypothetical protein
LSNKTPALGIDARVDALAPLIEAIRVSVPVSVSAVLKCTAFGALSDRERKLFHDDPTYLTLLQIMAAIEKGSGAAYSDPDRRVSIVCDETHKYCHEYLTAFIRARQVNLDYRNRFVSIGFADDRFIEQLQLADFLAGAMRNEADRLFFGKPFDLRELYVRLVEERPDSKALVGFIEETVLAKLVATRKSEKREKRDAK